MKICSVPGCERKHWAKGLCQTHYGRLRRIGDVKADMPIGLRRFGCLVEGCTQKHSALGYCKRHYVAFKRWGDPLENHRRVHVTEHGTYNEYLNYGCRCERCRKAAAEYQRSKSVVPCRGGCGRNVWMLLGHGRGRSGLCRTCLGKTRRTAPHGTETRYSRGCRCDDCRTAMSAERRRRRLANPDATRAYERARYWGRKGSSRMSLPAPLPAEAEELYIVVEVIDGRGQTEIVHLPAVRSNGWERGGGTFDSYDFPPAVWPSKCGALKQGAVFIRAGVLENANICVDCETAA